MSDKQNLIKLAVDSYRNKPTGNFSKEDNMKVLREALVDMNGGSTVLNYKTMRNNAKAIEMFEIIEEILNVTVMGGIEDNPFFQKFVETRNLALGDSQSFFIEDNSIFTVAEIAEGINNIRRQRISGGTTVSVDTKLYGASIYEELNRVLSGRVDMNSMIDKVTLGVNRDIAQKIYNALYNNLASLPATFGVSGAYSESALIDLCDHVKAATGKEVVVMGTKSALKNIAFSTAQISEKQKEQYAGLGYYSDFYEVPVMVIPQFHTPNAYTWALSNKDIYVMPVGTTPIKFVNSGEAYVGQNDPMQDAAFQMEYKYFLRYGIAVVLNEMYGDLRMP